MLGLEKMTFVQRTSISEMEKSNDLDNRIYKEFIKDIIDIGDSLS
jgi:hypothetical protein